MRIHCVIEDATGARVRVEGGDLGVTTNRNRTPYRVFLRLDDFVDVNEPWPVFAESNPDYFLVHPGRLDDGGLMESLIGCTTDNPRSITAWRTLIRRAKKDMLRGATFINAMGQRFNKPNHPYTKGALILQGEGVQMLSMSGTTRYELGGLSA